MKQVKTNSISYVVDSEQEALDVIEEYKEKQRTENYTLTKYKTDYKCKKDRKTGEILSEYWIATVTQEYEVML